MKILPVQEIIDLRHPQERITSPIEACFVVLGLNLNIVWMSEQLTDLLTELSPS
jgi:hypothetical protein